MSRVALFSLLSCVFFAGCYLPRTTPLAATNCHPGVATARFNVQGRASGRDEISGACGSFLYGMTDSIGVNLNLLYEEARHEENGTVVSRYSEFATTLDLVLELVGGEKVTPEGALEKENFSLAFYLGFGPVSQSWRGEFFEDEDVRYRGTAFSAHTGLQAEAPFTRHLWSEFYFDFYTSESLGFFGIPFWTIGTNLCYKFSRANEVPAIFAGVSFSNVGETVLEENWIAAVGLIWTFGGWEGVPPPPK